MDPCTQGNGGRRSSVRLLDYLRGVVNIAGWRLNESLKSWESSASLTPEDLGKVRGRSLSCLVMSDTRGISTVDVLDKSQRYSTSMISLIGKGAE